VDTKTHTLLLEWNIVGNREGLVDPQFRKNTGGLIEQLLAVHEDDVVALSRIELSDKPASGRFRNLAGRG